MACLKSTPRAVALRPKSFHPPNRSSPLSISAQSTSSVSLNVTLPSSCHPLPRRCHLRHPLANLLWRRAVLGGELLKIASLTEKGVWERFLFVMSPRRWWSSIRYRTIRHWVPRRCGHSLNLLVIVHTGPLPAGLENLFFLVWNCGLSTIDFGL
jgi:hypothetical protein